jgi:hypothetical protein
VVVVLLVVTGGATYTDAGAVVEYSVVVVVGAGISSAQAPTKPTDTATTAARETFFRSFILELPPLGTLFGSSEPKFKGKNSTQSSSPGYKQASCARWTGIRGNFAAVVINAFRSDTFCL